jgi:cephalosporin hydroxylase
MKLIIDTDAGTLTRDTGSQSAAMPLYSDEAFGLLSDIWVKVGWNQKYSYTFSWLGRPVIQLPEDMIRIQEAIWAVKPKVIVETGVAHGGSLIFYANLFQAMGGGKVVGVDIEIRPHNRQAIEAHPLAGAITLIEGSSTALDIVAKVRDAIAGVDPVLVILDSNHSRDHVLDELRAYGPLVTPGSLIVATDGLMRDLTDVPRGSPEWAQDNPCTAVEIFLAENDQFELVAPPRPFDESTLGPTPTHWPMAWLRRK